MNSECIECELYQLMICESQTEANFLQCDYEELRSVFKKSINSIGASEQNIDFDQDLTVIL